MKRPSTKKIILAVIAVLVVIQFFQIDKNNLPGDPTHDFITMTRPDKEVRIILEQACYDCHSNNTAYPWYTYIAPVSWWIKGHINEAREHLNFSEWGTYSAKKQDHKLEELVEEVEEEEMPLSSYTWVHKDAKLSQEQRQILMNWAKGIRKEMTDHSQP